MGDKVTNARALHALDTKRETSPNPAQYCMLSVEISTGCTDANERKQASALACMPVSMQVIKHLDNLEQ